MFFNSFIYLLLFLPLTTIIYFTFLRFRLVLAARIFLIFSSLFFYGFWRPEFTLILLGSVVLNFFIGNSILKKQHNAQNSRFLLISGIVFNLLILGYFKYLVFIVNNINTLFHINLPILKIILPLAISFFTFQQIAFLIDTYRGAIEETTFLKYCQFICFFPQLISGPINRYNQLAPQFVSLRKKVFNLKNISTAILMIATGLFKKVVLADSLGVWADMGFDEMQSLNFISAWITSLSYTFQIYFDFSGCIDIAIGSALLFNINFPLNFNSPYKAINLQDFWRRWHITLSNWLRDYLFLPIAYFVMNKTKKKRVFKIKTEAWAYVIAIMLTMFLAGIWHGAGWNFIIWGLLHGIGLAIYRAGKKKWKKLPNTIAWLLTFNFINFTWIFFRANNLKDVAKVIKGMFSFSIYSFRDFLDFINVPEGFLTKYGIKFYFPPITPGDNFRAVILIVFAFFIVLLMKNSNHILSSTVNPAKSSLWASFFVFISLVSLFFEVSTTFIYFQF